jgi:predicted HTH domain antitoxin
MILTLNSLENVEAAKRVRLAVALYDAEVVSQGRAAELAGLTRTEFLDALCTAGVSPLQYTAEEALGEVRRK